MASPSASSRRRLISTYYDTPDLALKRRGISLRVREQDSRFIQTVKMVGVGGVGDLLSRGEWEDELAENSPDPQASQSGGHLPEGIAENLRPLFATDVTRTLVAIEPAPATRIAAAIDEGQIRAAGRSGTEPISEIELELGSGDAAALYEVAMRLLEVAPIQIEPRSKSERGYRLGEGAVAAPPVVHAAPVVLDPMMSVEAALQEIGRACLAHLLHNEAAALEKQPEGVHQMRVAVRRMRSAISSFKKLLSAADRRSGLPGNGNRSRANHVRRKTLSRHHEESASAPFERGHEGPGPAEYPRPPGSLTPRGLHCPPPSAPIWFDGACAACVFCG